MSRSATSAANILRGELARVIDPSRIEHDPAIVAAHSADQATWLLPGTAEVLVRARSQADVAAVLRVCQRLGTPVVPRGAGSGLSGGANAVDGCVVLDVSAMNAIVDIDENERLAVVEPGVLNGDLNGRVGEVGLWYPPDPASRDFSSIGGNIATNAGGLCCVKYGVTRDWLASLEVTLASGDVITTGTRTRKNVAGYDLTSLLSGSEGTLGVVTAATLRLRRPAASASTLVAFFPTLIAAGEAITAIMAGLTPSLLELVDGPTLRAIDDWRHMDLDREAAALLIMQTDDETLSVRDGHLAAASNACTAAGADWMHTTHDTDEAELLLEARRLAFPAVERLGSTLLDDVGVPLGQLAAYLDDVGKIAARYQVPIFTFGHAGDGNLHPTIVADPADADARKHAFLAFDALLDAALRRGGTVTGEHGVGLLKLRHAARQLGPASLDLHRAIKNAFDPSNILNPGKLLQELHS